MNADTLAYWKQVAAAAESAMQGDDMRDIAAVLAAAQVVDELERGCILPMPTPSFVAQLAHAEVLAQRA